MSFLRHELLSCWITYSRAQGGVSSDVTKNYPPLSVLWSVRFNSSAQSSFRSIKPSGNKSGAAKSISFIHFLNLPAKMCMLLLQQWFSFPGRWTGSIWAKMTHSLGSVALFMSMREMSSFEVIKTVLLFTRTFLPCTCKKDQTFCGVFGL